MKIIEREQETLVVVNLDELEKLNNISLKMGYNRGFNKDFKKTLFNSNPNIFMLKPYMFHNRGIPEDEHIRYLVYQKEGEKFIPKYLLDLPIKDFREML